MDNIEDLSKVREIVNVWRVEAVNRYLRAGWKMLAVERSVGPGLLREVDVQASFVLGYDVPDGEIPHPISSWGALVAASGNG